MSINEIANAIIQKSFEIPKERSLLIGISGIDASGKGFVTAKLTEELTNKGFSVANINVDGWLNLPHIRFDEKNLARNFYENSIRFDEMFETLILPLKMNRSVKLTADFAEETATEFRKHEYVYKNIDIILLEEIFLLEKEFTDYYDLRIWINCSFEKALERAIGRSQEGLSEEETITAYETIYFPAQKIHFQKDNPEQAADLIFDN